MIALEVVGRLAPQLFGHEQGARDRRIEGGGNPGPGTGGQQSAMDSE